MNLTLPRLNICCMLYTYNRTLLINANCIHYSKYTEIVWWNHQTSAIHFRTNFTQIGMSVTVLQSKLKWGACNTLKMFTKIPLYCNNYFLNVCYMPVVPTITKQHHATPPGCLPLYWHPALFVRIYDIIHGNGCASCYVLHLLPATPVNFLLLCTLILPSGNVPLFLLLSWPSMRIVIWSQYQLCLKTALPPSKLWPVSKLCY